MAGGMHFRGHAWQGGMHAGEMATEAGGTHPAGMPTCLVVDFKCNSNNQTDELNAKTDVSRYFLSTQ